MEKVNIADKKLTFKLDYCRNILAHKSGAQHLYWYPTCNSFCNIKINLDYLSHSEKKHGDSSWIWTHTEELYLSLTSILRIFILECLRWHLSADNLWHIWCQSAITFLINGPKIMNIFFRWQGRLIMGWRAWFVGSILFTADWIFGYESMCLRAGQFIHVWVWDTHIAPQRKPGKRH